MNAPALASRPAVCSWSLQPESPQALLDAAIATGVPRVQRGVDIAAARVEGIAA